MTSKMSVKDHLFFTMYIVELYCKVLIIHIIKCKYQLVVIFLLVGKFQVQGN